MDHSVLTKGMCSQSRQPPYVFHSVYEPTHLPCHTLSAGVEPISRVHGFYVLHSIHTMNLQLQLLHD